MSWFVTLVGILVAGFVVLMVATLFFFSPGKELRELDKQITQLEIEKHEKETEAAKALAEAETIDDKIEELEAQKLQLISSD